MQGPGTPRTLLLAGFYTWPMHTAPLIVALALLGQPSRPAMPGGAPPERLDWKVAESDVLTDHVQLTFPKDFAKAGEAYFSPDDHWIIFQAVPRNPDGSMPPANAPYAMYVARLKRSPIGMITGIETPLLVSPPDSANTCGFFHPIEPWRILFGSTITAPASDAASGYQRGSSRYSWMMPREMEIVTRCIPEIKAATTGPQLTQEVICPDEQRQPVPLFERDGYDAECAYSPDGRFVVFAAAEPDDPRPDLHIFDTVTSTSLPVVTEDGYDGGPFFSPCGRRLCYRSDRAGDNLLQLYVAELRFDAKSGAITGVERETALTANQHVNWAPFWHPSGRFLVYATSEAGHHNYEVFAIDVPAADHIEGLDPANASPRRITHASGFDGLPVFNSSGTMMMWTSQRGPKLADEERPSSQLWVARFASPEPSMR